jgi:hypothetical protein
LIKILPCRAAAERLCHLLLFVGSATRFLSAKIKAVPRACAKPAAQLHRLRAACADKRCCAR